MKTSPEGATEPLPHTNTNNRSLLQRPTTPRNTNRISRKASKPPRSPSSQIWNPPTSTGSEIQPDSFHQGHLRRTTGHRPRPSCRLRVSPFGLNPGRMAAKITEGRKGRLFPSDETAFLQRSHTRQIPPRDRHGMRCLRPERPPAKTTTPDRTDPRREQTKPAPFVVPPRKSASNVNSTGLTPLPLSALSASRRETTS